MTTATMPPLTAELAGLAAVALLLITVAIVIDPTLRARRAANRVARVRRHAAQGCQPCRANLEDGSAAGTALVVLAVWCLAAALVANLVDVTTVTTALKGVLR